VEGREAAVVTAMRTELAGLALLDAPRLRAELAKATVAKHELMHRAAIETKLAIARVQVATAECAAHIKTLEEAVLRARASAAAAPAPTPAPSPPVPPSSNTPKPVSRYIPPPALATLAQQALVMLGDDD
jgi:hypothetical protein